MRDKPIMVTGTLVLGFKQGGPLSYRSRSASSITFVARSYEQARTHAPSADSRHNKEEGGGGARVECVHVRE